MRAGAFRDIVTVETFTTARNEYGELVKTWTTFATLRCEVSPSIGGEAQASGITLSSNAVRVRSRYLAGVSPEMRVVHGGRTMTVRSVIDHRSQHRTMDLLCEVNDGAV